MHRTSIVATLGPATSTTESIRNLIGAGMDVARLNFSHGTHEEHRERVKIIRSVSEEMGVSVACLQDLCGPKIRTGQLSDPDGVTLEEGSSFILTTEDIEGSAARVSTTYRRLHEDVRPGETILLDDGRIELVIESVQGNDIHTSVVHGGKLKPAKGINFPQSSLSVSALTDKDRQDAKLGVSLGVDYIALSFVRDAEDVLELKRFLTDLGHSDLPVIAKIEKPEAIEKLDEILDVVDGVMVARGDLGVELPAEEVPVLQKKIIFEAHRRGRPVITATQMLESMVHHFRPTRAEASDVANAILDGTDAVMLSAETAVGRYPVGTVETMLRISTYTESMHESSRWAWPADASLLDRASVARGIAKAACRTVEELDCRYVVTFTESGATARLMSHYRPSREIIALTPSERVYRQLALPWGITPVLCDRYESVEEMSQKGLGILKDKGLVETGDTAVIVFGTGLVRGATNVMIVHEFG